MTKQIEMSEQTQVRTRMPTVALVAAGLLILTSALFPSAEDPADYSGVLDLLVDNAARTKVVLLTVPLGIWALAAGIASVQDRVRDRAAASWLRLGLHGVLIGAAAVTVQFALASAGLANRMDGASDGTVLWAGATYVRSFAMLILWAGLAAVGRAVLIEGLASRWLGFVPIPLATAMVLLSAASIVGGPTKTAALATGALAGLTAIWSVLFGISLARR